MKRPDAVFAVADPNRPPLWKIPQRETTCAPFGERVDIESGGPQCRENVESEIRALPAARIRVRPRMARPTAQSPAQPGQNTLRHVPNTDVEGPKKALIDKNYLDRCRAVIDAKWAMQGR